MPKRLAPIFLCGVVCACGAAAATPTPTTTPPPRAETQILHVGDRLERFALLQPGVHRYLRYKIDGSRRTVVDLWTREIRYETKDGQPRFHIVEEWDGAGADAYVVELDSWFEPETFRPLTHEKRVTRGGTTKIAGYRFFPDKIVGMAELPDNTKKDFSESSTEPAYNFVTDMELLQTLPLRRSYVADINFYDPGLDPPARYRFAVAGSDVVRGADGRPIDCWVVTADYNDPKATPTRFWFAKGTQVLVREESKLPDGSVLVKTLLHDEWRMPT